MRATTVKRRTRLWVRLAVGLLVLTLVCIHFAEPTEGMDDSLLVGPAIAAPAAPVTGSPAARLEDLARTDHVALLRRCLDNYDRTVGDFTCRFIKRERLSGRMGRAQEIDVKFMDRPFSVAMRWRKNAPISDRCLFIEGANGGDMLLRPKGLLSIIGTVRRKPDSKQVMSNTLRPVNLFGFRRGIESLIEIHDLAAQRGELEANFIGHREVAGRQTLVLERILPPRSEYPAKRTLIYIDVERRLPICIEGWDWDDQLTCRYIYSNVKLNVGLTGDDFTPDANGL